MEVSLFMKLKKITIISFIFIILLCLIIVLAAHIYIGQGTKDIKACKAFMNNLHYAGAIDKNEDLAHIKYKREKKSKTNLAVKSITSASYGFDLDENNNIIGFMRKDIKKNITNNITVGEAEILSLKYLQSICNDEVQLKNIETNTKKENIPYYSFIYTRKKNGYTFYFDEIKLNINKENGLLDGYSNSTLQKNCREAKIIISKDEAEQCAVDYFLKSNKYGAVEERKIDLFYVNSSADKENKEENQLCYLIIINGKDVKDKNTTWKVFVNTENGDVVKFIKNESEKEVKTD